MDVYDIIKRILVEELKIPEQKISPHARLTMDLGIDSIEALDMVIMLETKLGISLKSEQLSVLKTVKDVVEVVELEVSTASK